MDRVHIKGLFLSPVVDLHLITESPAPRDGAAHAVKAGIEPPFLHGRIYCQMHQISRFQFLEILGQGNLAPLAVMPSVLVARFPLLGSYARNHPW